MISRRAREAPREANLMAVARLFWGGGRVGEYYLLRAEVIIMKHLPDPAGGASD